MGHASITTTLDRYGHLLPGGLGEAAALLDAYLAGVAAASAVHDDDARVSHGPSHATDTPPANSTIAAVSKTVSGGFVRRGFKSLPLRL